VDLIFWPVNVRLPLFDHIGTRLCRILPFTIVEKDMNDQYQLQRFVDAQRPVFQDVCKELREGNKRNHWMWFIFPQIKGLGRSDLALKFAISSLEEAQAYLKHPILGPRLRQCSRLVAEVDGRPIEEIFGYPDTMKFRSSMTLFAQATPDNEIFNDCLRKYFGGEPDPATLAQL
jgi:uncharacterized protein (DUF1810 family)